MKPGQYDEVTIDRAVSFLYEKLNESGKNSKPVGLHSIRVASILWSLKQSESVIIAALLHDLVEDTDTNLVDISEQFGAEVAKIVEACTFDYGGDNYLDKLEGALGSIDKARAYGVPALMVKAADFIDNSNYYSLAQGSDLQKYLYDKYMYFMKVAEDDLKDSPIMEMLVKAKLENVKVLGVD